MVFLQLAGSTTLGHPSLASWLPLRIHSNQASSSRASRGSRILKGAAAGYYNRKKQIVRDSGGSVSFTRAVGLSPPVPSQLPHCSSLPRPAPCVRLRPDAENLPIKRRRGHRCLGTVALHSLARVPPALAGWRHVTLASGSGTGLAYPGGQPRHKLQSGLGGLQRSPDRGSKMALSFPRLPRDKTAFSPAANLFLLRPSYLLDFCFFTSF